MASIKRIYDPAEESDGYRVLVDRLWPRGLKREDAAIDDWAKEIAPSASLREWFGHKPERWAAFEKKYRAELQEGAAAEALAALKKRAGRVTLLTATRDLDHCHARALQRLIG
ncbi:MAG: DUF488 family protein [Rhodoblastus sp.]